jgi:23S rRNA pseudouridine1911/1915/1917 synthase
MRAQCSGFMVERQKAPAALGATIPASMAGERLDRVLARLFSDYSRARMQRWVRDGRVEVDGAPCRDTRARVAGGERLRVDPPPPVPAQVGPEAIELQLVYRDEHLLVLDKPAGLVVHPGAGNRDGTLVNALVHLDPSLSALPRAGLVHRLDKNTSGLMIVACTLQAQTGLSRLIAERAVHRGYEALVHGIAPAAGRVDAPVGRHRVQRTRMSVREGGRHATTDFRRIAAFRAHSHLALQLGTGRTHQIRVHMAHLGHPIIGDREYGGVRPAPAALEQGAVQAVRGLSRQALHASRLRFEHPISGHTLALESALPADIAALLAALDADARR